MAFDTTSGGGEVLQVEFEIPDIGGLSCNLFLETCLILRKRIY